MPVSFHKIGVSTRLTQKQKLINAVKLIGLVEQKEIGDINVILVSDKRLLEINRQYLNHNYYTDIITFQHPTPADVIAGDLYISMDRVGENANHYRNDFKDELARVIIHGVLHLCGYRDKKPVDKKQMRKREDFYLKSMKTL